MEERRSDADRQRRARQSEGDNRGCQNDEEARDSSRTACETGRPQDGPREPRANAGDVTGRAMTPLVA